MFDTPRAAALAGLLALLGCEAGQEPPAVAEGDVPAASEPEVQTIQAGRRLHVEHFDLDGEVLLECREKADG